MGPLPSLAQALGVTLSGSVIAVPSSERTNHARSLTQGGHWVHADRIEGSYRGQPGVSLAEVRDLAKVPEVRLDVHLVMLTPPGKPGFQADLDQLAMVRAAQQLAWPVGVDGGVTDTNLESINRAGVRYAVAGRALVQEVVNQ